MEMQQDLLRGNYDGVVGTLDVEVGTRLYNKRTSALLINGTTSVYHEEGIVNVPASQIIYIPHSKKNEEDGRGYVFINGNGEVVRLRQHYDGEIKETILPSDVKFTTVYSHGTLDSDVLYLTSENDVYERSHGFFVPSTRECPIAGIVKKINDLGYVASNADVRIDREIIGGDIKYLVVLRDEHSRFRLFVRLKNDHLEEIFDTSEFVARFKVGRNTVVETPCFRASGIMSYDSKTVETIRTFAAEELKKTHQEKRIECDSRMRAVIIGTTIMTMTSMTSEMRIVRYIKNKVSSFLSSRNFKTSEIPYINEVITKTNNAYNLTASKIGEIKIAPANVIYELLVSNPDVLKVFGIKEKKITASPLSVPTEDANVFKNTKKLLETLEESLFERGIVITLFKRKKTLIPRTSFLSSDPTLESDAMLDFMIAVDATHKRGGSFRTAYTTDGLIIESDNKFMHLRELSGVYTPYVITTEEDEIISNHVVSNRTLIYTTSTGKDTVLNLLDLVDMSKRRVKIPVLVKVDAQPYGGFDIRVLNRDVVMTPICSKTAKPLSPAMRVTLLPDNTLEVSEAHVPNSEVFDNLPDFDYRYSVIKRSGDTYAAILKKLDGPGYNRVVLKNGKLKSFPRRVLNDIKIVYRRDGNDIVLNMESPYLLDTLKGDINEI